MNDRDVLRLNELNERYSPVNLTGFRLVNSTTDKRTVLTHIERDIAVLNSCDIRYKEVCRVIVDEDCIDICTGDNGTFVSYFFTQDAKFTPQSLSEDVKTICNDFKVNLEDRN